MVVSDKELLAVELVPRMRDQLELLIAGVEKNPGSDFNFYSAISYMDALIDMRVFPIKEINAARDRIKAATTKKDHKDNQC